MAARRAGVSGDGRTRAPHGSRAAAVSLHKKYLARIIPAISEPGRPWECPEGYGSGDTTSKNTVSSRDYFCLTARSSLSETTGFNRLSVFGLEGAGWKRCGKKVGTLLLLICLYFIQFKAKA